MSVALVITNKGETERLLPWAWRVAVSDSTDLVVIRVLQRHEDTEFIDLEEPEDMERAVPGLMEQWNALNQLRTGSEDVAPVIDERAAHAAEAPLPTVKLTVKQLTHPQAEFGLNEQLGVALA